jgi:hypothetical protein
MGTSRSAARGHRERGVRRRVNGQQARDETAARRQQLLESHPAVAARHSGGEVLQADYIQLLALVRRRLSDDEVAAVVIHLVGRGELGIDTADIGAAIIRITDKLPFPDDLDRVRRRLDATGWPADPTT